MKNNLNILIVDDNEIIQELLSIALKSLGHRGVVVNNGEEALRCLHQRQFDLILMDVTMPVMDGLTALLILRKNEEDSRIAIQRTPVILITGNDLPSDLEKFSLAGANGFVSKPIDFNLLTGEIKRVLSEN